MGAKDLLIKPISAKVANDFVREHHYSGKVAPNSQIHLGVYYAGSLEGVLQFGPSLDKAKVQKLVDGTAWNGFLELNRMAFSDVLPRNSESRAIAISMKIIKKHAPNIDWVVSYSDGTQCGDGTIYRASGFYLTGIKKNTTIWQFPDGETVADISIRMAHDWQLKRFGKVLHGSEAMKRARELGAKPMTGFQLRYIYFVKPESKNNLTVPLLPFSKIAEMGATMYKGSRPGSIVSDASDSQSEESGAIPTPRLQPNEN